MPFCGIFNEKEKARHDITKVTIQTWTRPNLSHSRVAPNHKPPVYWYSPKSRFNYSSFSYSSASGHTCGWRRCYTIWHETGICQACVAQGCDEHQPFFDPKDSQMKYCPAGIPLHVTWFCVVQCVVLCVCLPQHRGYCELKCVLIGWGIE